MRAQGRGAAPRSAGGPAPPAISPPPALLGIARALEGAGSEAWVVGGALRDLFTGEADGDWDLATSARPAAVRSLFSRTVPLGVEHGTVGVHGGDGVLYEVTTFRRDVETDGRHAVVAFADTIEEDLARRDFTINALAWHPGRGELIDPFCGIADLEAGVLRAVGAAEERFREDYLRVLRGLRFAGRLGLEVEADTWRAMRAASPRLVRLSAERIREELLKVLAHPRPSAALRLYAEAGSLAALYPELAALATSELSEALRVADLLPRGRPLLRLAGLARGCGADRAGRMAERLKLSKADGRALAARVLSLPLPAAASTDAELRRWLSRFGGDALAPAVRLELARVRARGERSGPEAAGVVSVWRRMRAALRRGDPLALSELALGGRELMELGVSPGPAMGRILHELLDHVLEEPGRNSAEQLAARVRALGGGSG